MSDNPWDILDKMMNTPTTEPTQVQFNSFGRRYYYCKDLDVFPPPAIKMLELVAENEANLIGSLCEDGFHRPVLDIDIPSRFSAGFLVIEAKMDWEQYQDLAGKVARADRMILYHHPVSKVGESNIKLRDGFCSYVAFRTSDIRFMPSSTTGNGHLYIDRPISWGDCVYMMQSMAKIGMLEEKYVEHSINQGMSMVRPPWVKKTISRLDLDALKKVTSPEEAYKHSQTIIVDQNKKVIHKYFDCYGTPYECKCDKTADHR